MTKNGCQCVACRCAADATIKAAASIVDVGHNRASLPGVLRYRGMENEAVMAARLVKIESLIANLRSVLGGLEASMGAWATPSYPTAKRQTETAGVGMPEQDLGTLARRHVQLVEEVLATALSKIRTGAGSAEKYPIQDGEQHFDARARRTDHSANGESIFREEQ